MPDPARRDVEAAREVRVRFHRLIRTQIGKLQDERQRRIVEGKGARPRKRGAEAQSADERLCYKRRQELVQSLVGTPRC